MVGPKNLITALSQSGSFLDGGANHPLQLAAIPLLNSVRVHQEKISLQKHFHIKRDHVLSRLKAIGLKVRVPPRATFYVWLDLEGLPAPINNGLTFFEELLKEKTIVIPGIFFDINPSHRRNLFNSPCHHFVRLSFGPPLEDLDKGRFSSSFSCLAPLRSYHRVFTVRCLIRPYFLLRRARRDRARGAKGAGWGRAPLRARVQEEYRLAHCSRVICLSGALFFFCP